MKEATYRHPDVLVPDLVESGIVADAIVVYSIQKKRRAFSVVANDDLQIAVRLEETGRVETQNVKTNVLMPTIS